MNRIVEQTKKILEIDESDIKKEIIVSIDVPQHLKELYDKFYDYMFKELIKLRDFWDFDSSPEKIGDKDYSREFDKLLRKSIRICGGAISDLIIEKGSGIEIEKNDIDFFVDNDFFYKFIIAKIKNIKNDNNASISNEEFYLNKEKVLIESISFAFGNDAIVDQRHRINNGDYDVDVIKDILGIKTKKYDIDIILYSDSSFGFERITESFDFFFRGFSYDGKFVYGNKKALEDINLKQLSLLNLNSVNSTLVRSYMFENRYGFKLNPIHKKIIYVEMFKEKHITFGNYYHSYCKGKIDRFRDTEKTYSSPEIRRTYSGKSILGFLKFIDYGKKVMTEEDFFVAFYFSFLKNIKSYQPSYKQAIIRDLKELYSYLISNDPVNQSELDALFWLDLYNFEFHNYGERLDHYLKNSYHLAERGNYEIKDFELDVDNLLSNKGFFNECIVNDLDERISETQDMYELIKSFSNTKDSTTFANKSSFASYFNEVNDNMLRNDYSIFMFLNVLHYQKYKDRLSKDFVIKWMKSATERYTYDQYEILPIYSKEVELSAYVNNSYFETGRFYIDLQYKDPFKLNTRRHILRNSELLKSEVFVQLGNVDSVGKNETNENKIKKSGADEIKSSELIIVNGTDDFKNRIITPKSFLIEVEKKTCEKGATKSDGLNLYLGKFANNNFYYVNGTRYEKILNFLKGTFNESFRGAREK